MLLKAIYKAFSGMFRWKKYEDEIIIPIWELIVLLVLTGLIVYLLLCSYHIYLEWADDEHFVQ